MTSTGTRPSVAPKCLVHKTLSVNGEKSFHKTILGDNFEDDRSARGILPGAVVLLYAPKFEYTKTFNTSAGRSKTAYTHIVGSATVKGAMDAFGVEVVEQFKGHCEDGLDRIILEDVSIIRDSRRVTYPYLLNSNSEDNPATLGDLVKENRGNCTCVWDSQAMRANIHQGDNGDDDENDGAFTLKEFHVNNYDTIEIWLRVSQVRNVKNPLRDVNTDHRDEFVRTFQDERYQVGFGMISVTFETEDIGRARFRHLSDICNMVDGRPELKEGKSLVVVDGRHRLAALQILS